MTHYVFVSYQQAEKRRRKQERDQIARALYETRNKGRSHHGSNDKGTHNTGRNEMWATKPFIMWDGEGPRDAGYALFGNSAGFEICHPFLSTVECLQLILDSATANPNAINVAFGFNYDVSNILKDLPRRYLRALIHFTRTIWKGWEIEHVPHKWFKIKYGTVSCTIYDIRSFFAGNYQSALDDFGIGTNSERQRITKGKGDREYFLWAEIKDIYEYWKLELKLGVQLCNKLRDIFADAGYIPRSWHGPGALARMALRRHHIYDAMAKCPKKVQLAAQYAFAGGHFELFQAGDIQEDIYNVDIHSAYPHYATFLPNLNNGKWRKTKHFETNKFAVYHIQYKAKPSNSGIYPLFRRLPNGNVVWIHETDGWYWQPEAELVANDSNAKFIMGWVFDENDPTDRPFAFLHDYYMKRKELQDAGNAAEYTFKLIINAIYGQLAQRVGWDRKHFMPPKSHQLEWAGYITSACRAAVYRLAARYHDRIISIDTDGIFATCKPDDILYGANLGEWEITKYTEGLFWQSGIYCLRSPNGEWKKARSRGIKKGTYSYTDLRHCLDTNTNLYLNKKIFVTYGLADMIGWDKLNTWQDEPHEYVMGGGKRVHSALACKTSCQPPRHRLWLWTPAMGISPDDKIISRKHHLPWIDGIDDDKQDIDTWLMFDANHLDDDDTWMIDCRQDNRERVS